MRKAFGCILIAGVVWGVASFVVGCGSAIRDEPRTAPTVIDTPELALGQRVFAQNCYQCHPGGAAGLAPAINNKPLPEWAIKTQVREGLGAMPAFSKEYLSDEQLDAVVVYLQALRASGEAKGS